MPRDLPLGNGRLLVGFDKDYQLRDIYYPNVGRENQTDGAPCRMGVWADGQFAWLSDAGWERDMRYLPQTLVSRVRLVHPQLGLQLTCYDTVDFHEDVLVRRFVVENLADQPRDVRLFFHHDFNISGNAVGDTAYYKPDLRAVIHYKGPRYFLISGQVGEVVGLDGWATGVKGIGGKEGTWRDAEDGELGGNPITQGSVDSTVCLKVPLAARDTTVAYLWMCAATAYEQVKLLHAVVQDKGPQALISRTSRFWSLWVNKEEFDFNDFPPELIDLYKRSLLTVRTQIDDSGAIIAANDSDIRQFSFDTYSYMWPRDGALVAYALDRAGYDELTRSFFNFCNRVITPEGYFLHKYNADGTLASSWHSWLVDGQPRLPIQEDETALVLWSLWEHFHKVRDIEFIKPLFRNLIVRAADFMVGYRDANGLPQPSWDLWEERWGIHAFTVGAVYGGLIAAASFANAFGERDLGRRYKQVAEEMKAAACQHLWSDKLGRFVRMLSPQPDGTYVADETNDAALMGLFYFGMYPTSDEQMCRTMDAVRAELWIKTEVGGVARYHNDYYHQVSQDLAKVPGNPWFICTMWLAQWDIARASSHVELTAALETLHWTASHALPSGVLAEQVDPYTNAPLSVSPLTWSHAVFVAATVEYLDKLSELSRCDICGRPLYTKEDHQLNYERTTHHHAQDGSLAEHTAVVE
ncbi:MAG: glycoside hydrolase family 15 protein [Herpetosiphonaceae bacterium]|nr:glycoside hydrolase family 15 protein [Herpetosiphonaceae bacterium]